MCVRKVCVYFSLPEPLFVGLCVGWGGGFTWCKMLRSCSFDEFEGKSIMIVSEMHKKQAWGSNLWVWLCKSVIIFFACVRFAYTLTFPYPTLWDYWGHVSVFSYVCVGRGYMLSNYCFDKFIGKSFALWRAKETRSRQQCLCLVVYKCNFIMCVFEWLGWGGGGGYLLQNAEQLLFWFISRQIRCDCIWHA